MARAILSVYDKTGLEEFARGLAEMGWDLVASGGTARALSLAGLAVTPIEALTHLPEMLAGRVKTLHPAVHAGILARDTGGDYATLSEHGFAPIDMVIVNLYPFQLTASQHGVSLEEVIEQIDIGGVALVRAAAKNYARVTVLTDAVDYAPVLSSLHETGKVDPALRQRLAVKAFQLTHHYDAAIHAYLRTLVEEDQILDEGVPPVYSLGLTRVQEMRYGENPHQAAGLYAESETATPLGGELLGGKPLSYNNLLDLDAAWRTVNRFDQPAVVIVKHLTPTGVAFADSVAAAFPGALASDPVSAFGGVIAVNRPVDEAFVTALESLFVEAIVAPDFSPVAQEMMGQKRQNCRLLRIPHPPKMHGYELRSIVGGYLIQQLDAGDPGRSSWRVVSERQPTSDELQTARFGWRVVQHVKSNAIVLAQPGMTVGIGGGLPSRVDAARLAITKAGERSQGAVMASDAFFPFADGIEVAAEAGITCVVQPGGSIRDQDVIDAANERGLAMVFTGVRHFRH